MLRRSCSRQGVLTARKRALFFCVSAAVFGLCGILFTASCSRNVAASEKTALSSTQEISAERHVESGSDSRAAIPPSNPGTNDAGQPEGSGESSEIELERIRLENAFLREENNWLRSKVTRLNEALVEANQTIYSLNRKLDAIFKPEAEQD